MITRQYTVTRAAHQSSTHGVADPERTETVELTIDDTEIARWLGVRAMRNKKGAAAFMDGLVTVRIVK